jgi:putative membrane protein
MKLPELKAKFKNKYAIRIVSGVLVVAMLGTGVSASQVQAAKNTGATTASETVTTVESTEDEKDVKDALSDALDGITVSEKEIGKDETVYVIADSTGAAESVIVSDHLINNEDKSTITDASTLQDITNVKGDETFTQNGNELTWQADGNDIYYQGTSQEELPVTQKITYYLDGKEIAPDDLAGQSGKVTIRFDYSNNQKTEATIAGKTEEIYVPFMAISGMILGDNFSDVTVTNGKVIADGDNNMVIGYALPGLKESLGVDEDDFEGDVSIPDYFEVTANVEDFELNMTMTAVVNASNFVGAEGEADTSSVDELLDSLTDATNQLQDGSQELADGVDTLQSSLGEFSDGMNTLADGVRAYTDGAATLATGIGSLQAGVNTLADNVPALTEGVGALKSGSADALSGAQALAEGAAQVSQGVDSAVATISGMGTSLEASKSGVYSNFEANAGMSCEQAQAVIQSLQQAQENLKTGIGYDVQSASLVGQAVGYLAAGGSAADETYQQLAGGAQQAAGGAQQYYAGVAQALAASGMNYQITNASEAAAVIDALGDTIATLENGIGQVDGAVSAIDQVEASLTGGDTASQLAALQQGASQVSAGAASLASGLASLDAGLGTLNEKSGTLGSGVSQLKDGAAQLANGASTLVSNNDALNNGASQLKDGTDAIVDGVGQLDEGAHQLADGVVTFNEEGIEEILNAYDGDVQPLIDRIQAVLDAGADYQSYTAVADGVNGSVKFIFKTAAIKAD